ncbi:MAG: acyl-CoA desaturase [Bacteroidetes bacterium]|nr:acyl-CoA desaturase [Bacteroidota bacterium]
MRNIKFKSHDEMQARFAAAVRKNVDNYFKEKAISPKGNWEIKLKSAAMLAIYLVPFALLLFAPMHGWLALLLAVVMGLGKAGIGMGVMHDAAHGSYSRKRWVNELMSANMYLLGSNVFNWKVQHNVLHHTYTNIDGLDGDIASHGPIRLSEHSPVWKIHRYQHLYAFFLYGLMTLSKMVKDFRQLHVYNKAGITREHRRSPVFEMIKVAVFKAAYLFVFIGLPLLLTGFTVWQVLAGFFLMHWVTGVILSVIFQLAHVVEGADQPLEKTSGIIENDWMVHELQTTADFARNNRLLGWYIGGLNFQIEHHLFPHISHVHYRHIAPIVEQTAHEFGYAYNVKPTFINALTSHVQRLKELGTSQRV